MCTAWVVWTLIWRLALIPAMNALAIDPLAKFRVVVEGPVTAADHTVSAPAPAGVMAVMLSSTPVVPGATLAARGIPVDDTDASYLYEARMATLWPINEDGLFTGEDTYTGGNGFAGIETRKLAPGDIVELAA